MKTPTPMKFSLLFLLLLPLMGALQDEPPNCGDSDAPCPDGMCCSKWGYCGTDAAYCDPENCLSQCPAPNCGESDAPCQEGMCCSKWGFCGTSYEYCAPEICVSQCPFPAPSGPPNCGNSDAPCPDGMCCSKWGYCGADPAYCDPENCVSQCTESSLQLGLKLNTRASV